MKIPKDVPKKIDECITNFDFIKVHKVMTFLNWTWFISDTESEIPTIGELVIASQSKLYHVYERLNFTEDKDKRSVSSGGLKATAYKDGKHIDFILEFILTDWNTFR